MKNDIGILFDVSGSMKKPFNSFNFKYSNTKADEIINLIEKICSNPHKSNNEKVRIFSILFGGSQELIYDFCSLLEIANNLFCHSLTSDKNSKAKKYGFGQKFEKILSEIGTVYLSNYLYCDSGPTERLCEMGYYLLRDDCDLRERIYEKLPYQCKSWFQDKGVYGYSFFSTKSINKSTEEVINDIYETCIDCYASKIMSEEINQRKISNNTLKFMDGNNLINIKKNLEDKLASPNNTKFNLIDLFTKYIYGSTPLYTALNISFDNFKKQSSNNNNKFLFIISDGELNDIKKNFDYIGEIRKKATDNNVTVISIFLTKNNIPKVQTFYDEVQTHFTGGSKDLFLMSSTLTYEHQIIKFFINRGWNIPNSGECKLFIEINNSQNLNDFIDLMNEAIGELNYKNNAESIENPYSLANLLASTEVSYYVNSNINQNKAQNQGETKTCYANAVATTICLASARVWGRETLKFFDVREKLINKFGKEGANIYKVLNEVSLYRLKYKTLDEEEDARKAIINTRPCLATFKLNGIQAQNFKEYFKKKSKRGFN